MIILRAGVTCERQFLKMIAEDWPRYATRPGRNETSLEELSFEAWVKQYKPSENFTNRAVSYYEKGLWTAMALDLELRLATDGARGLPEMIPPAVGRLRPRRAARSPTPTCAPRCGDAGHSRGRFLDRFFDRYVRGTDELPLPALLARAGLDLDGAPRLGRERPLARRARSGQERPRARLDRPHAAGRADDRPQRGAQARRPGAPGLTFNDEIVAVDGARVTPATFAKRIADRPPGARVRLAYFRRDELREARLTLAESPERRLSVTVDPHAGARANAVRAGWFGLKG